MVQSDQAMSALPKAPGAGAQPTRDDPAPVIELRGTALTYPGPPSVSALRPSDLVVRSGEFVAITGPSGSGKSTLLNVLGLLDAPTAGAYLLDGIDTGGLGDADRTGLRAHHIGFVFQDFHLLPYRTAEENVQLAMLYNRMPRPARADRAITALEAVGLAHRIHALPTTLSGGERQRVAIARAMVSSPSMLLCDEPTGNLDSQTAGEVLDVIAELNRAGMTVVMITHDAQVAERAMRRVRMRDGMLDA